MIEQDTVRLLRECDAGIKMGVSSINDVLSYVKEDRLKKILKDYRSEHRALMGETKKLLCDYHDNGKDPNPFIKSLSKMKSTMALTIQNKDTKIADLMTDGCNMGIKSLSRYLNQYTSADEASKSITKRLITVEENMAKDMRDYL